MSYVYFYLSKNISTLYHCDGEKKATFGKDCWCCYFHEVCHLYERMDLLTYLFTYILTILGYAKSKSCGVGFHWSCKITYVFTGEILMSLRSCHTFFSNCNKVLRICSYNIWPINSKHGISPVKVTYFSDFMNMGSYKMVKNCVPLWKILTSRCE